MSGNLDINLLSDEELIDKIYKVFNPQEFGKLEFPELCAKYEELGFVAIHVSDLRTYKRCRRQWAFSSPFRLHLGMSGNPNPYFWFGSGIHFAMEDYYGYNLYDSPIEAFHKYYQSHTPDEMPSDVDDLRTLGVGMLETYLNLEAEDKLIGKNFMGNEVNITKWPTAIYNGKPAVEVPFVLRLDELSEQAGVPIVVHGTIDRIVEDPEGNWWPLDWKTAKSFDTGKLINDQQVTHYLWAGEQFFDRELAGMIYVQMRKDVPHPPKKLVKGGFSQDKKQLTTFQMYVDTLLEAFGEVPQAYDEFLNVLMAKELEGNRFVDIRLLERNECQKTNWFTQLTQQVTEMINPYLSIYPNPTKDCSWDCDYRALCIMMEQDVDYASVVDQKFVVRTETAKEERQAWRIKLDYDNKCKGV